MKIDNNPVNIPPLHICVVTQQLRNVISGIGLHANNLINNLLADGHRVTVVVPEDQLPDAKVPFYNIKVSNNLFRHNQARWLPLSYLFAHNLYNIENELKIDIFHFTDAREAFFFKSKIPIVGNVNDTYAIDLKSPLYYRQHYHDWLQRWIYYSIVHHFEKTTYPRLQAIIANSNYTAEVLRSIYPIDPLKVFTIHKTIDLEKYKSLEKSDKSNHSQKILFIGGNMQRKGLPTLIKAAPIIIDKFPNCEFIIVGRDKAEKEMKSLTIQSKVSDHFHFLGWQDQLQLTQLYLESDIFVLPSITEAFGVVILEAMACGVPVVASNVGGIPEIITNGENGITVPPNDPGNLAQAIINLLKDKSLQIQIIQKAYTSLKNFDVKIMMMMTYKVYESILKV